MSFRLPRTLGGDARDTGYNALEAEVLAEKAASLGIAGKRVETALDALRACTATEESEERERLTATATDRVWAFLVQRELCGLRDTDQVIADYRIPANVLARLGSTSTRVEGE